VRPGHEVGEGSDSWVAPVGVPGHGTHSSAAAVERGGARLLGCLAVGRELGRAEKKEGRVEKESRPRGGGEERKLGRPRAARERVKPFPFYFLFLFSFKTNLFQNIFKTKFKAIFNF